MKLNETILEVMRNVCNFFDFDDRKNEPYFRVEGSFEVVDGNVVLDGDFAVGDWIAVTGSRGFDGIYLLKEAIPLNEGDAPLEMCGAQRFRLSNGDEEENLLNLINPFEGVDSFVGVVNLLIPQARFIPLCVEIKNYMNNPENFPSAKTGENVIGFYSWTRAMSSKGGKPLTVFQVFADRLVAFRKMFTTFKM